MKAVEEQLCNKNYLLLLFPHHILYTLRIPVHLDVQTPVSTPLLSVDVMGVREIIPLMC